VHNSQSISLKRSNFLTCSAGVNFISNSVPLAFSKKGSEDGAVTVKLRAGDGVAEVEYDTVLIATGRSVSWGL
jgi:hypothetical protein